MIITIDGPAGSGKSTVARKLATTLGFIHLNSGALFRAVAVQARDQGVSLSDEEKLARLSKELNFRFALDQGAETSFSVDGVRISEELSGEEVGALASAVALLPSVRNVLLEVQRELGKSHSLVVEGRDSGTVVFPKADKKFFLVANETARANRRLKQLLLGEETAGLVPSELLKRHGWNDEQAALEAIRKQLGGRDRQDGERKIAPHRKAEDAVEIDTSEIGPDEVVEKMLSLL
jgi:cytidylate kinase